MPAESIFQLTQHEHAAACTHTPGDFSRLMCVAGTGHGTKETGYTGVSGSTGIFAYIEAFFAL